MGPNDFPLPTSDPSFGPNVDTQWDDVLLDNPILSLYQLNNNLPHVLPQELEYAAGVYPVFPIQEQLGQFVETSLQLGAETQELVDKQLRANGPGPNQVREHRKRNCGHSKINSTSILSWVRMSFHYPPVTTHSDRVPIIPQLKETASCSITPTYLRIGSAVHFHKYHHRSRNTYQASVQNFPSKNSWAKPSRQIFNWAQKYKRSSFM